MSLTLEQKKSVIAEVSEVAKSAQSAVAAEYSGLSVAQMTILRAQAREMGVIVRVVKNSLAKRAFEGTDFACLNDVLTGQLVLLFSPEDLGASARLARDFAKDNENLVTKAIALDGEIRPASDLLAIAALPTLDEARASLLRTMQAPATQLVRTLAEPGGQMVRVLAAYRDRQQAA